MWKFLDASGCTWYNSKPFLYNLPCRDEKWAITEHPEPVQPDGLACGPGGLHLKKSLDVSQAPINWWPWWAKDAGTKLGEDSLKIRTTALALRRVPRHVFWRCLRPPFNWGREANLSGADLRVANLYGADLTRADLRGADLSGADLRVANLYGADLSGANLRVANLYGADLSGANLRGADLRGANTKNAIGLPHDNP